MPLSEVSALDIPFERILIYGDPKTGKTRLATSLPAYFGNILYYAADPGSESLTSVITEYRKRIHVIKSRITPGKPYDPDADAFTFVLNNWSEKYPLAKTIVWDTLTATSTDVLSHIADTGQFSDKKHIPIGSGTSYQNIPMQGDYMATQNRISRLLDFMFRLPMHLIILFHSTYDEPRNGESIEGGPATVGKASVRTLPGRFDTVLYTTLRYSPPAKIGEASQKAFTVYTERHKIWSAGIRSSHLLNPMPIVKLESDPINFWNLFITHHRSPLEAK